MMDKCGTIYHISCLDCDQTYVGESGRPLRKRVKKHKNLKYSVTAVGNHMLNTGHGMNWNDVNILGSDTRTFPRKIKEAMQIKAHQPAINENQGYGLSPIYTPLIIDWSRSAVRSTTGSNNSSGQAFIPSTGTA